MHAPVFENRMRRFSFLYRHSPGSIFTEFPCPWFLVPVTSAYLFVGMRTTLTPAVSPARTAGDFLYDAPVLIVSASVRDVRLKRNEPTPCHVGPARYWLLHGKGLGMSPRATPLISAGGQ
jgi:hypothetical protein